MKWDEYFMRFAILAAQKSKCATQVGAALVKDKQLLSTGYNGLPCGVIDPADYSDPKYIPSWVKERQERPEKYYWESHADTNCLLFACRYGIKTLGSSMYITGTPCSTCARNIIQAGVVEVKTIKGNVMEGWEEEQKRSLKMFSEANVRFLELDYFFDEDLRKRGCVIKV